MDLVEIGIAGTGGGGGGGVQYPRLVAVVRVCSCSLWKSELGNPYKKNTGGAISFIIKTIHTFTTYSLHDTHII